jgi:hypothetical protein
LKDSYFDRIRADKGFLSLRQHFPSLNSNFSKWRTKNVGLRAVEKELNAILGMSGNKPTAADGMATLRAHNDALGALVAELTEIQGLTGIEGQCDQCEESASP